MKFDEMDYAGALKYIDTHGEGNCDFKGNHDDICKDYCGLYNICLRHNREDTENPCEYCEWYHAEKEACTWNEEDV